MRKSFGLRLLPLVPITLACSPESRELPSAPSTTAHQMVAERPEVPSPRGSEVT